MTHTELMAGLIALIPFVILFYSLGFTKVKPAYATTVVLILTAALATVFWRQSAQTTGWSLVEGGLVALLPIIWVIAAAVFTYHLGLKNGGIDELKRYLLSMTTDRNVQAVLVAFCFGGFLESVAGFGTAVAIPTAILMAIGFPFVRAAVICLVANSVPVAFGSIGLPVIVLANVTHLDLYLLTRYIALQLLPFSIFVPVTLSMIAAGTMRVGWKTMREALLIGVAFATIQTVIALFVGPELVAVLGSLGSLAVYVIYKRLSGVPRAEAIGKMLIANSNYIILIVFVALLRAPFAAGLKTVISIIDCGGHKVSLEWLTTPGTLLFTSSVLGALICGLSARQIAAAFTEALDKIKWSAWTIINLVALAKLMGNCGMIGNLAEVIALVSGGAYPAIAPAIGTIGTFITGSDTSSNILFGGLQKSTAHSIGANVEWITASNTSGATAGKMISPQSISVATATAAMPGKENSVLRAAVPYCAGYVVVLGAYVFLIDLLLK